MKKPMRKIKGFAAFAVTMLTWGLCAAAAVAGTTAGKAPSVKVESVSTDDPWSAFTVNYTLGGIDAAAEYKVAFEVTIDKVTRGVTNAVAKLADGAASKDIDTVALFGGQAKSDSPVSVRLALIEIRKGIGGVQLWETGPYWAEWNAGASRPEEGGVLGRFDAAAEAVRKTFGAPWRVPTMDELQQLAMRCDSKVTTSNGVPGRLFTSPFNGQSVFFPFAGCLHGDHHDDLGVRACSWSSTVHRDTNYVHYLSIGKGDSHINWTGRAKGGATVRAVRDADDPVVAVCDHEIDLVNYLTADGFAQALAANPHRVTDSPAKGGDFILKLANADGSSDFVHVFLTPGAATFTTAAALTARVLAVGGGGAGGNFGDMNKYDRQGMKGGGGGGAGAVVEKSGCPLAKGTFSVTVGAGGVGCGFWDGTGDGGAGGASTLAFGETTIVSALGGGGGGSVKATGNGGDGGCGGGAAGHPEKAEAFRGGKGETGRDGGSAAAGANGFGCGGGGMGTAGSSSENGVSGNGGNGVICDILGYRTYFGGGGAGGGSKIASKGGLGGGASAGEKINAGTKGLGGGGAGSARANENGGTGGSGAIVIRYTQKHGAW